jgi:protein-L-isoaspartate O-methyltransferase
MVYLIRSTDASQPYDAIIVTAAAPAIPKSLKAQLAVGGRMIIPITDDGIGEDLVRITRNEVTPSTTPSY